MIRKHKSLLYIHLHYQHVNGGQETVSMFIFKDMNKNIIGTGISMLLQWNPDFSNLQQGKSKLVREIGSSRNQRLHQIRRRPGIV